MKHFVTFITTLVSVDQLHQSFRVIAISLDSAQLEERSTSFIFVKIIRWNLINYFFHANRTCKETKHMIGNTKQHNRNG